jgi:hypothetical protein
MINALGDRSRGWFVIFGLLAGALFTGIIGSFGAHFVWELMHTDQVSADLELPKWFVYACIPLGSYLMCYRFLQVCWSFVKTGVPMSPGPAPRSSYPLYYFFNGYGTTSSGIEPDWWMNDVGEKIPNWFENARLYYAYTGDASVMQIAGGLVDYALAHGTSSSTFAWPNFPMAANAGDTEFRGFTDGGRFALHEIQVDHAAEVGLTYYRMYLYTGDAKYLTAARNVADVLASKARTGTATQSAVSW